MGVERIVRFRCAHCRNEYGSHGAAHACALGHIVSDGVAELVRAMKHYDAGDYVGAPHPATAEAAKGEPQTGGPGEVGQ